MTGVRPRELVHRGVVEAAAFLVDEAMIGTRAARARILARWTPGARVFRSDDGLILVLPAAERIAVERAPGAPLVRHERVLVSAPLRAEELAALSTPRDGAVLVRGGRALVAETDDEDELDPAEWLDVAAFTFAESATLGLPPAPPQVPREKPPVDLRAALRGKVPDAAPELEEIRAALARERRGGAAEGEEAAPASAPRRSSWAALARAMFGRAAALAGDLLARLSGWARAKPKGGARTAQKTGLVARPAEPPPEGAGALESFLSRLRDRLHGLAAKLLRVTNLSRVIGRRQAEYISRMMDMFERGDLGDALRHAIPLSDMPGKPAPPALSVPTPRSDLRISGGTGGSRTSLGLGVDLFEDLRRMYRRAFERLEREGRYEEAAFVLAELLHSSEEAVMFLEKHGFLQLAAELAESRKLAPGLIVRQWFVAGQAARAVSIARRTGAFADAVVRLERTNPEHAKALRLLWADTLAEAGDYAAAIDVVWPVEDARHLAKPWIERAIENGGPAGARMLVRALVLESMSFADVRGRALALLEDDAYETLDARMAFAGELVRASGTPATRVLARPAVRSMMRAAARWSESLPRNDFDELVTHSRDPALRADLPVLPRKGGQIDLHHREHPKSFTIGRDDTGTMAIADVAVLPSGRILVALGDAGVRLLARDGRTIAHFDHPARHLVVSDHGDRVITLIERGPVYHLTRLDLGRRKATPWCEMMLAAWAKSFDGSFWFAATRSHHRDEHELLSIDATHPRLEALWRLDGLDAIAVARSKTAMSVLSRAGHEQIECWQHDLPSLVLRRRTPFPLVSGRQVRLISAASLTAEGLVGLAGTSMPLDSMLAAEVQAGRRRDNPSLPDQEPTMDLGESRAFIALGTTYTEEIFPPDIAPATKMLPPAISSEWFVLPLVGSRASSACILDAHSGQLCGRVELEGATTAAVRLGATVLAIADDRGRIVIMEHKHGRVLYSLRV